MWERQKFTGGPWEPVAARAVPAHIYRRANRLLRQGVLCWDRPLASEKYIYRFLWAV